MFSQHYVNDRRVRDSLIVRLITEDKPEVVSYHEVITSAGRYNLHELYDNGMLVVYNEYGTVVTRFMVGTIKAKRYNVSKKSKTYLYMLRNDRLGYSSI